MQKLKKVPANWKTSDDIFKRLAYLVNKQMSGLLIESAENILHCGATGGFTGFIYYSDTCEFYDKNEEIIFELSEQYADDQGAANLYEFWATFGGAKQVGDITQHKNLLAWFAMEEAARYLCDNYKLITE